MNIALNHNHTTLKKSDFYWLTVLSVCFSIALVVARSLVVHDWSFYFLIWNLFLGALPLLFAQLALKYSGFIRVFFLAGWLLFLPNSFYIITDLFHLKQRGNIPLWYDLLLILSFAWNGCLLGFMSVSRVERLITYKSRFKEFVFVYGFMVVNAFGVYIGRYWRYNSWDVVSNPFELIKDIGNAVFFPANSFELWAMTLSYSFLMTVFYLMIKIAKVHFLRPASS